MTYDFKDAAAFAYGTGFHAVNQPAPGLGKEAAGQDVGRTSVPNRKSEIRNKRKEDIPADSTEYAENPNRENNAASITLMDAIISLFDRIRCVEEHLVSVTYFKTTSSVLDRVRKQEFVMRRYILFIVVVWKGT